MVSGNIAWNNIDMPAVVNSVSREIVCIKVKPRMPEYNMMVRTVIYVKMVSGHLTPSVKMVDMAVRFAVASSVVASVIKAVSGGTSIR
jgi:hypothetical protein